MGVWGSGICNISDSYLKWMLVKRVKDLTVKENTK